MATQPETAIIEAELSGAEMGLTHLHSGKVREIFATDDDQHLLLVTTDRISAFDVVMEERILDKGRVLNLLSEFWFDWFEETLGVQNHLVTTAYLDGYLRGRTSLVRRLTPLLIECIARDLITGSFWTDYQEAEATDGLMVVQGITVPVGMQQSEFFPETLFTPSTKADIGHDEALSEAEARQLLVGQLGWDAFDDLKERTLDYFGRAKEFALERGIIIADTKLEFGLDEDGKIVWDDEAFTPDSSRFVLIEDYEVGEKLVCRDKQILRNYLQGLVDQGKWDKTYPPPPIPEELVEEIRVIYRTMYERITVQPLPA